MTFAQGVTTASMSGSITDNNGEGLIGANVIAVHTPSGTRYGAVTQLDGRYRILNMRVGGPYQVTISYIGYQDIVYDNITLSLGSATNVEATLREDATELIEIVVEAQRNDIFSSDRTGAGTNVTNKTLKTFPTISRQIGDFTRLTPQASGNSFAGTDRRFNNITVDGTAFNNSFGLGSVPGGRTGVAPISLDAIEEIQVNIAPYDVRQGNFVGAGVNTVTKSGTNEFSGTAYYLFRNESMSGTEAGDLEFNPGKFNFRQFGATLGGPIIKDKLFFFASFENDERTSPATTFRAQREGEEEGGNITRVLASDLDALSDFLRDNFNYETGSYEGYDDVTQSTKFLIKLDYNISDKHKLSLRYNHLNSSDDVLVSNSGALGAGNRRTRLQALNFANSNYKIQENIRSFVAELNSNITNNLSNNFTIGYTFQNEDRDPLGLQPDGSFFPLVDILLNDQTYTTFGFEPFSPENRLEYTTLQIQNNLTYFKGRHTFTGGFSVERYNSLNSFYFGLQSAYVYNSLEDFYTDANGFLANPNRTTSPVELNRFQVRYSGQPGSVTPPTQDLAVTYAGIYVQDEWQTTDNLKLTLGFRADVPIFGETGFFNPEVPEFDFRDENGNTVNYSTDKLPDANILWSPRIGFNWDVTGDKSTQIRGGSGLFSGRPAYVWISNQIGNNGVLSGFESRRGGSEESPLTDRPFNPNPDHYKPEVTTVQPAERYNLAFTDPNFKFPQVWRSNIAIDQKLPWGLIGTFEAIYTRDVNGIYYIDANLDNPTTNLSGSDDRPFYSQDDNERRIIDKVTDAMVLKNQNDGYSYNLTVALEKPFDNGFYGKIAYTYGRAKNIVDPSSIARSSFDNNPIVTDPNNAPVAISGNDLSNRIIAALSYTEEYFNFGATTISLFWEGANQGRSSYTFSGDANGDDLDDNDLIYIPRDVSEMNFQEYTSRGVTYTAEQQAQAFEQYIQQDEYLSERRGQYAERNGVLLPMVYRADLSIVQDIFTDIAGKRNALQFRIDILNVGNLLNRDWGVGQRVTNREILNSPSLDENNALQYRLPTFNGELINETFQGTANTDDVYRIQLGLRYTFN